MDVRWTSTPSQRPRSTIAGQGSGSAGDYIFVMENVPEPVQPGLPVNVQLPEIVFPAALPVNVRVFPVGVPDCTVMPNVPVTWPLKFPARVNEPVSVSPVTKQGELVVNLKLKTLTEPLLSTWSDVPKARTVELLFPMRVAFHFPLRLDAFV